MDTELIYLNLYLELDAHIQKYHCPLHLPAAVLINRLEIPHGIRSGGEVIISGRMHFEQRSAFYCPFFMRSHKTHFYHELIRQNATDIKEFEMNSIEKKLRQNPGYLMFEKQNLEWNIRNDKRITITVRIEIGEVATRFQTSFWQYFAHIWMQYLSVFIVFVYFIDKLKSFMFGRQFVRAWETVPWKKLY